MAYNIKGMTKILIGKDVFLSINSINGEGVISLCKGRIIPSAIYPHRPITIPSPHFVTMSYSQFIELIDKAPLLSSVFKSIKEKDFTQASDESSETHEKDNCIRQKKSRRSLFQNKRRPPYARKRRSLVKQKNQSTEVKESGEDKSIIIQSSDSNTNQEC